MRAKTSERQPWWLVAIAAVACTVGDPAKDPFGEDASGSVSGSTGSEAPASDDGEQEASGPADDGGTDDAGADDGSTTTDASADAETTAVEGSTDDDGSGDGTSGSTDGGTTEGGVVEDGVIDVTIVAHDDCTITTMPAAIAVPEGTEFTVNWISAAANEVNVDVAKIDQFNQVPIIIGMEPGTSYHDEIREWCGELFTGTFDFRITSCFDPHYIPVDCSAD